MLMFQDLSSKKKMSRRELAPVETSLVSIIRIKKRYRAAVSISGDDHLPLANHQTAANTLVKTTSRPHSRSFSPDRVQKSDLQSR